MVVENEAYSSCKAGSSHSHSRLDSEIQQQGIPLTAQVEAETAAEYVKSRLPEALKQHLQDYEKDKENSVLSYQTILEQQILSIDREMLEKLTVSYDEAGLDIS
ncbi:hypothetical protein CB1_038411004 [Camelus ferus]|nr:hypothetical protein CB1_038411004 [Camelus ferus]